MEQIAGPIHGFHLACYTVCGDGGYYGYAKICSERPANVWQTSTAVRKLSAGPYAHEECAMRAVLAVTERRLADRALRIASRPAPLSS